jgi:hypothetical protein
MLSVSVSDEVTLRLTDAEMAMLASLAETRARADAGNARARKQMTALERKTTTLGKRAKRGDAKAARLLRVLNESGILQTSQTFAMNGGFLAP